MEVVVVAEETVDAGAVGVNATYTSTKEMLARTGTTKTHGTVHMAEAGITEEGDTTNLQATPRHKPTTAHTEGTPRKAIIRITNRAAGTGASLNRPMIRGLHIKILLTEVVEGDTILATTTHTVGQMGILGGEEAHIPREEVRRTVAVGMVTMAIKEVVEGGLGTAATVEDTTNLHKAAVMAEVATVEVVVAAAVAVVITPVKVTSPAEVISREAIHKQDTNPVRATNPADHITPVLNLMGAEEDITKEVVVVGEDINHTAHRPTRTLFEFCFMCFPLA